MNAPDVGLERPSLGRESEFRKSVRASSALGYFGFEAMVRRGLMRAGLVPRRAFRQLRLHRLEANTQPCNLRSLSGAEPVGADAAAR